MGLVAAVVIFFFFFCLGSGVRSDGADHKYSLGDPVPLYANKIGPFHNPRSASLFGSLNSRVFLGLLSC